MNNKYTTLAVAIICASYSLDHLQANEGVMEWGMHIFKLKSIHIIAGELMNENITEIVSLANKIIAHVVAKLESSTVESLFYKGVVWM